MLLDGFKWDAQIGDRNTLAPFALVLPSESEVQLTLLAEAPTTELLALEEELKTRATLWPELGLPRRLVRALETEVPWTPSAARVIRFDFHPTADGWSVSEANSDVPGGYTEGSTLPQMFADHFGDARPSGDPASVLCDALADSVPVGGHLALLAASGYLEDQQIIAFLGSLLRARGVHAHLSTPENIRWTNGNAQLLEAGKNVRVDAIFRFFQGEWISRLPGNEWRHFFRGGITPVANPGAAVFTESKRLPLLWSRLRTPVPTWQSLLPSTLSPWETDSIASPRWVLKEAYCNTGDTVISAGWSSRYRFLQGVCAARLRPRQWIAQRRFETTPIPTPLGAMRPCIGVYTVNGKACGLYGRISPLPVIDYQAIDIPILIRRSRR